MDRPEPFRDLDWDPKRARELGERALDLWVELLEKLPDLPIGRRERAEEVGAGGVQGEPRMTLYASEEVHLVVDRAADMLGLGTQACRHIAVDDRFRMRPDEVRRSIELDLTDRSRPIAIIASAGSVATGSIDPLNEL